MAQKVISPNKAMPLKKSSMSKAVSSTGGSYKGAFKKVGTKQTSAPPVSQARKAFLKSGQRNGSPTKAQTF